MLDLFIRTRETALVHKELKGASTLPMNEATTAVISRIHPPGKNTRHVAAVCVPRDLDVK
eukprot:6214233-Pleurochrysis_carterae.AAC.1